MSSKMYISNSFVWIIINAANSIYGNQLCNNGSALLEKLPDSALSSSSQHDNYHGPWRSRLNTPLQGEQRGGWSAGVNQLGQYIQADMQKSCILQSVAIQGRADYAQWVTLFYLQLSTDGNEFDDYNNGLIFMGNSDQNTIVLNKLNDYVIARYIRLYPVEWYGHISMRWEVYGCCQEWYSYNDKAYCGYDGEIRTSFSEAERECALRHARLPIIENREQDAFISVIISDLRYRQIWIDLSSPSVPCGCLRRNQTDCESCRTSWKWRDGSDMQYSSWIEERPIGYPRECAVKVNSDEHLSWTDLPCSSQETLTGFICQYDCHTRCHILGCEFTNEGGYSCKCEQGYTGSNCDQVINECESSSCQNGAECQDLLDGFRCNCKLGTYGILCENVLDKCVSGACVNGDCVEEESSFKCNCTPGYTGILCESPIDECESNPCQNGGTCFYLPNNFKCVCPLNYYGDTCDKDERSANRGIIALAVICGLFGLVCIAGILYIVKLRRELIGMSSSSGTVIRSKNEETAKHSSTVYEEASPDDGPSVHYANAYQTIDMNIGSQKAGANCQN